VPLNEREGVMTTVDERVLVDLRSLDTPTICNALEVVAPERRGGGFTTRPLVCAFPDLPPMVGYARTATIRAMRPGDLPSREARSVGEGYYEYIATGGPLPSIAVIQDLDGENAGFGAFWGEVNSHVHRGLGSLGVITDGSIRDLDAIAEGFQLLAGMVGPSHAFVHVEATGLAVEVAGMQVSDGDLVHADRHGAVVIPTEMAGKLTDAAGLVQRREAVVIEASKQPDFDMQGLRAAWSRMRDA
jgi:regulator of RNase E activity RraA